LGIDRARPLAESGMDLREVRFGRASLKDAVHCLLIFSSQQ
jgi:hypothetical protein